LLESAPSVIYSFKASGDYAPTFVSENIKRLLGYCPDEYLKNSHFWRARVHPDDLASVEAEQATLFEHDRDAVEYRFRQKDGGYRWVRDEQHLLRDAKGEPFEIVGSWIDITGRRKAEAAEDAARARLSVLIIGSVVNLAARLQSYADLDGILLGHETYSLIKDDMSVEEQEPMILRGFAEPVRCYRVLGVYDALAQEGTVIREEGDGFKVLLDLQKGNRAEAIAALESIVARLKG
jgi:PAS domain S-box-containing protein